MMTKADKTNIVKTAVERFGAISDIQKKDLTDIAKEYGFNKLSYSWLKNFSTGHGVYDLQAMSKVLGIPVDGNTTAAVATVATADTAVIEKVANVGIDARDNLVPNKDPLYVKTNEYKTLETVISAGVFYPIFITGMSGNGKSLSVIQAAANKKRELIRINVTKGTNDDDLIGHWNLVNGETRWTDGPVTEALRRGALILIDEIDMLDSNRAAGLFTILEGKGVYIKQTNELVKPAPGFNIIATANTKGKGSDDGRFMGTNVLNEAFLERFPITLEYAYPGKNHEKKILTKLANSLDIVDNEFIDNLVNWATIIRKTFEEGAVDEIISTRRLVAIMNGFSIFGDKRTAIQFAINRFDTETSESFMSLYEKLDANLITADENGNEIATTPNNVSGEEGTL